MAVLGGPGLREVGGVVLGAAEERARRRRVDYLAGAVHLRLLVGHRLGAQAGRVAGVDRVAGRVGVAGHRLRVSRVQDRVHGQERAGDRVVLAGADVDQAGGGTRVVEEIDSNSISRNTPPPCLRMNSFEGYSATRNVTQVYPALRR
jgi:hypothetical protein